ncbi:MAG: integration host factor subunit beta [Prevotellaceae bacterium]|jgi:DNA-binding protein HU-beta|nr:integration host factor subunit beta [Prevotellaceae bacterium]
MTKADVINEITKNTGINKEDVLKTVMCFMDTVKGSLVRGDNVYLRSFGSFIIKRRAEKTGRNILKNTTIKIPAHNVAAFKPSKEFAKRVK